MIELKGIAKTFRRTRVLDNLSLSIGDGDRIALIGSNGAGKTTLIRCLLGEYVHDGEVLVDGVSPRSARTEVLRKIAFVPQLPPPLRMPVGDLVSFAARICRTDPERIAEVAERLGQSLEEVHRRPFMKLSGGQKQKILIAIAMGREANVLIMDEPTANLDPAARQILFELLSERLDRTMIISSHRLEEVAGLVNRVIEMDRGKVVLDDRVEDAIDPGLKQDCRIVLRRPDKAFANAVAEWGFSDGEGGVKWNGVVAGPDRLRFLGMLARYAGLLSSIEMRDSGAGSRDEGGGHG